MKLSEWGDGGFSESMREYVAAALTGLGAAEQATLYGMDSEGFRRALVATDSALIDCRYMSREESESLAFQVRVLSWDQVPPPWTVLVGFVTPPANVDTRQQTATVTLEIEPLFSGSYREPSEIQAALAFVSAVLRARGA